VNSIDLRDILKHFSELRKPHHSEKSFGCFPWILRPPAPNFGGAEPSMSLLEVFREQSPKNPRKIPEKSVNSKSPKVDTAGEILLNVYFNEVCLDIELRHWAITPP
jgi:hypothetical protein